MNKAKATVSFILPVILSFSLTACNATSSENNPSAPPQSGASDTEANIPLTEQTEAYPGEENFSFFYDDDFGLYNAVPPEWEERSGIDFDCGYICYHKPGELGIPDFGDWNGNVIKVKKGDVLDNGLKVKEAYCSLMFYNNAYHAATISVEFEGSLTLTGTLTCDQEDGPVGGLKGDLLIKFQPEDDYMLPYLPSSVHSYSYHLGNINDEGMPEGITEIVNTDGVEEARVKAVISDIKTRYSAGKSESATLLRIEPLD
ncbi:MAG: hypothetical protein NC203_08405 [Firmicutes bacterium]|nr:hypothetical protein [[Eubacterium] siraeum]MCM1488372.1 hypothetical protein [Bacillota bacterium]